ncbi:MAG: DUF4105 domain-containing protein [Deltaproteobacteria bacterium]|nr:DUF4105 domain-containing protein [Deltaproteobacteria bacterium]
MWKVLPVLLAVFLFVLAPEGRSEDQLRLTGGKWSEEETASLQRFYRGLPADFLHQAGPLTVQKTESSLPGHPEDMGGRIKDGIYYLPIYRDEEIKEKEKELFGMSATKKGLWELVFSQNLIATPYRERDVYFRYLEREIIRGLALRFLELDPKHLSESWLRLTPWKKDWSWIPFSKSWEPENIGPRAFGDPRGMKNPKQDLASAIASFLAPSLSQYEDSIRCRMPAKYHFVRGLFPHYPPPLENPEFKSRGISCFYEQEGAIAGLRMNDIHTGEAIDFGKLNQDNLLGFELLYATPGDREISEIAGHLLLRIKLNNNPLAKSLEIENPYDLVVAFLADSRDFEPGPVMLPVEIKEGGGCQKHEKEFFQELKKGFGAAFSALRGLAGFYSSMVQVDTLQYVKYHYAVVENRSLHRYRLKLSKEREAALLERLVRAYLNHQMEYRFFTQNCGGILVKILAGGISLGELEDFSPWITPPNLLIQKMDELGLLERVYPDFHSIWSGAYHARDWILQRLKLLKIKFPGGHWPDSGDLFSADEAVRVRALYDLSEGVPSFPGSAPLVKEVLLMFQKAELYFAWNEEGCFDFRTTPKTHARELYRKFNGEMKSLDLEKEIDLWALERQKVSDQKGSSHTGYLEVGVGSRYVSEKKKPEALLDLRGSLYSQELSDVSYRALGRASLVTMLKLNLSFDNTRVYQGSFTGLRIRKIKERLDQVPSLWGKNPKMGIGLRVLELEWEPWSSRPYQTRALEGEIFTNLISSSLFEDHLTTAIGLLQLL